MTKKQLEAAWKFFNSRLAMDADEFSYGHPLYERWEVAYYMFKDDLITATIDSGFDPGDFEDLDKDN